jgi:NitT/TauT family transport system ATP-binding protein
MDEPFSALDVLSAEALRGELMELWLSKRLPIQAILLVTHNIEEAVWMADRLILMDKDPGRVIAELEVRLPHPRRRKDAYFQAMVDRVYATIAGRTEEQVPGKRPGEPGRAYRMPEARINAVAGLTEKLLEEGGWADLYRLAEELRYELDDMLTIVEAAELLGFVKVAEGDITLTPLGEAFAEASILARKEIVAGRLLRLPFTPTTMDGSARTTSGSSSSWTSLRRRRSASWTSPSTGAVTPSSSPTMRTRMSSSWRRSRPRRWIKSPFRPPSGGPSSVATPALRFSAKESKVRS